MIHSERGNREGVKMYEALQERNVDGVGGGQREQEGAHRTSDASLNGPLRLVDYSSSEDDSNTKFRSQGYLQDVNILADHEHRICKTPEPVSGPQYPTPSNSPKYSVSKSNRIHQDTSHEMSQPLEASVPTKSPPVTTPSVPKQETEPPITPLPTIRRIIAQQGDRVHIEYYPQWVSTAWLHTRTSPAIWNEWVSMTTDEDSVLTYTHSPSTTFTTPVNNNTSFTNPSPQAWQVLRSEVASDNDSGDFMAIMLEETVRRAILELGSRTIAHVLAVPVEFLPGCQRRATELLGRSAPDIDISTFLGLLSRMSPRERRKFDSVKVQFMGQVDARATGTKGRTHRVSAVEYLGPVYGGWKNPLQSLRASSFFRDMARESGRQNGAEESEEEDEDEIEDADQGLSEYATLQRYKTLLLTLISSSPWLLHPHSHLTSLIWTLIPRKQLKRLFSSTFGITLPHDWHTYMREQYLCRYSEDVLDKRSWHDLLETSLFLNKHFKDLKMAELGVRDEDITEDEGDSDAEDYHPSSGVTAANNVKAKSRGASMEVPRNVTSRKRGASEMDDDDDDDDDASRVTEIEDDDENENDHNVDNKNSNFNDDDDDDDEEYKIDKTEENNTSESDEGEFEPPDYPARKPMQRCGPVKTASSKAPRRAAIVDPGGIPLGKRLTLKARNERLAFKKAMVDKPSSSFSAADQLTPDEWAMLLAMRARRAPY